MDKRKQFYNRYSCIELKTNDLIPDQVRDLKPNQEDFLVPLLRELWPFKHRHVFFGTPCMYICTKCTYMTNMT